MKQLLIVSLILNLLFGSLSYIFYSQKRAVQAALISCQESNSSLEKTIEKQKQEKTLQDTIISEYESKQRQIQNDKCKIVKAIFSLPSRTNNEEINIDSKLPPTLRGLLSESYNSVQGKGGSDASKSSN